MEAEWPVWHSGPNKPCLQNPPDIAVGTAVGMAGLVGISVSYRKFKERIRENMTGEGFAYLISKKQACCLTIILWKYCEQLTIHEGW